MTSDAGEEQDTAHAAVKLLVVDDDRASVDTLRDILETPDRQLVVVGSGADALKQLASGEFALALLSLALRGAMDALGLTANVKALEATRRVPIIVLAPADPDTAVVTRAYDSGAVDVITRPYVATIMRAKVAVFVDLYRARQQVRVHELRARGEAARLAANLVRAEELQRQFLATLAKELRPPLNAIVGWIRMLRDGSIREAQRGRALETVERNAVSQLAMIEEMLDISRMTSGQIALELGTVDLAQITEQAVEAMRPIAVMKQVTLFAALERDIAPMSGDAERLRQIVDQLVRNAVSCTPTEGVVTVSLSNVGADVVLAITDTGPGVDPGGAGLALVRHLVELHDGRTQVESAGAGQGCRFVVSLPAEGRTPRTDDEVR